MPIDKTPPEGSNLTPEQWETVVDRTDHILNVPFRNVGSLSDYGDSSVRNPDVYRLVRDENGVPSLQPVLREGDSPDKYTQAKRILEAARNKERLFFRSFKSDALKVLTIVGDPPQPIVNEMTKELEDEHESLGEMPVMPEKMNEPSWFGLKSFLNNLFGWFEDEVSPYRENQAAIESFPQRLKSYEAKKFGPHIEQYKEHWEGKKAAERGIKVSIPQSDVSYLGEELYREREIARRYTDILGAKPNIKPDVRKRIVKKLSENELDIPESRGDAPEMPEYTPPEGVGEEWSALTLSAFAQPGLMYGLKDDSTEYPLVGPEEEKLEIDRYNKSVKVLANIMAKEDSRCDLLYFGIQRGRERADTAWREFAQGEPEKAAKMLSEGLTYLTQTQRQEGAPDNYESLSTCYALKLMVSCVDKHPALGKYVDEDILQEARGSARLYDEAVQSKETIFKLLTNPPQDENERRELLFDAMVSCALLQAVKLKKVEVKMKSKAYMEADDNDEHYKKICAIKNLPPEKLTMKLGNPEEIPGIKADIANTLQETAYFKKLMAMPPQELFEEMSDTDGLMRNTREALVQHAQQKLDPPGEERQSIRRTLSVPEVKTQIDPPAPKQPII